MADRIHPGEAPPVSAAERGTASSNNSIEFPLKPANPIPEDPVPPPGTYVIQVPKDQIYRYPPPENASRYQKYSRQQPGRSCCRRCLCWSLASLCLIIVLLGAAAGIFYLVVRPESPNYSIQSVAVRGFNLTSPSPVSPRFDVTVRAENPNNRIGIHYLPDTSMLVYFSGVDQVNGVLATFYQPSNNVTVIRRTLIGSNMVLTDGVRSTLRAGERRGRVPLRVELRIQAEFKLGAVRTWPFDVRVRCAVTVDRLTPSARIVNRDCDYRVKPWL